MSQHQGGTDSVHKVKLPSEIQRAAWCVQSAAVGEAAPLEVYTLFVGDGSEVKCEVRTKSGKTVGTVQGKVGQGRCLGEFLVPEKATEDLYFEAQLSKHGLKARSGLLQIVPRRKITNARWDRQEARRGDIVKLSADTENIPDGTKAKITIFEHDADGAHDLIAEFTAEVQSNKVETEWEYEYHEDTDEIPTQPERAQGYRPPKYFYRVGAGRASAESGLLEFKDWVEILVRNDAGRPTPDVELTLTLADGTEKKGKTDGDGILRIKDVPPGRFSIRAERLDLRVLKSEEM